MINIRFRWRSLDASLDIIITPAEPICNTGLNRIELIFYGS
ncbi:MAG: hypothetical protein OEU26_32860 [Candidatus Tectomicrobia bacterium]|nr:hypothetical protein [Candidatus Tectomicrobia bacterium]